MKDPQSKKKLANSSAAIISIAIHLIIFLAAGSWVAFRFIIESGKTIQVEEQKKLERRKLQIPVKVQPFMEQMTKPKAQKTTQIAANTPRLVNIQESDDFIRLAPSQTFKDAYTNFVTIDRTLEFNSKYRTIDFGISSMDFFGTRSKAEKAVIVVDASKSMLYDSLGGAASYEMIREELTNLVTSLRSATLFNMVVFDGDKVSKFKPSLIPATPTIQDEVLQWFSPMNTNLLQIGLTDKMNNYRAEKTYSTIMNANDIQGWLKGFQAALEMKPDAIFILSSAWGTVTDSRTKVSYFKNSSKVSKYQKERASYFLADDHREEMDEYTLEIDDYRKVALKMLELENQARNEQDMPPKVVSDWDEILNDNDISLPLPPMPNEIVGFKVAIGETRYTMQEVLETLFIMLVDNYGHQGLPRINLVMLRAQDESQNSAYSSSNLTSEKKFQQFVNIFGRKGRFRYLNGEPSVDNMLSQTESEIKMLLENEEESL